jgi:hypothetical protein
VIKASPASGKNLSLGELERVADQGLRRFQLKDLIDLDVEVNGPNGSKRPGEKLKRVASEIGPPGELVEENPRSLLV